MSKTVEQLMYGTGWLKCSICGLTAAGVVTTIATSGSRLVHCTDPQRCARVLKGEPLGPALVVGPLKRFELDAAELELVDVAVKHWRLLNVDEAPSE